MRKLVFMLGGKCENLSNSCSHIGTWPKCENPLWRLGFRTFSHLASAKTHPVTNGKRGGKAAGLAATTKPARVYENQTSR